MRSEDLPLFVGAVQGYISGQLGLNEATQRVVELLGPRSGFGCSIPLEAAGTEDARCIAELTQAVLRRQAQRWFV